MDRNGLTIASSNRHQADSFVDKDFKFRPYFKKAVTGTPGQYWALGVTSKELGYYASYPVRDKAGRVVGVAVLKRPVGDMEAFFPAQSLGVVSDSHGIVVMANRPEMVLKSLWPLSPEIGSNLVASPPVGAGPFAPILAQEPVDGGNIRWRVGPVGPALAFPLGGLVHIYHGALASHHPGPAHGHRRHSPVCLG